MYPIKIIKMKKWIKASMMSLLLIIATVLLGSLESCTERVRTAKFDRDSVLVENAVKNYMNPQMQSPKQALSVKQELQSAYANDSIFRCMNSDVLQSVATVLLNKQTVITVEDIVTEYTLNQSIYDNLIPRASAPKEDTPEDTTVTSSSK